ncbi:MAG: phytase [Salibacteraceae bacterium]|nr:phytase [Salibacteraceae bacterium]
MKNLLLGVVVISAFYSCDFTVKKTSTEKVDSRIKPLFVSDTVLHDTDDPAIWINPIDASQSLIIGTDKDKDGALYVFNLEGKTIDSLVVRGLQRPNNVDIAYGILLGDTLRDIALVTERMTHKLRVFTLPDLLPVDNGGIEMFKGETADDFRDLMGIAAYKKPETDSIYAIVGRKSGPTDGSYLWQYLLNGDSGFVTATLVRKFGAFSGKKEIESIAVDNELGYIYYSDEQVGVRKYYADPEKGNVELALFATTGFAEDNEGISIYKSSKNTGYILVSDQGANRFQIFSREGETNNPHSHSLIKIVDVSTMESDGSDVTNIPLNKHFPQGLFVAMSTNKTFHYYSWKDIMANDLSKSNK